MQVRQDAARVLANDGNTGSQPRSSFGVANESTVEPSITTSEKSMRAYPSVLNLELCVLQTHLQLFRELRLSY